MSATTAARLASGQVTIAGLLYRADKDNNRLEDITDIVTNGEVNWNGDQGAGVKLAADFTVTQRDAIQHRVDWLIPVLRLTWADGLVQERQIGLFLADVPEDELSPTWGTSRVRGFDPTYLMWSSPVRDTYNIAAADVTTTKVQEVIAAAGLNRYSIPASTRTAGAARSWFGGTRRFDIAAQMLEAMNWYHPYSDLEGIVRSGPIIDVAYQEPAFVVDQYTPVGKVRVVPTTTTLANVVAVINENGTGEDSIVGIAVNDDAASPTSTVNMVETYREFKSSDVKTQAEAEALAESLLREGGSYYRVLTLAVPPGIWIDPYQAVDVYIHHENYGCLCGRYHLREWKLGFTPRDAALSLELNLVVPYGSEEHDLEMGA